MTELGFEDKRYLEAAEGWLGLDNWQEANAELDFITSEMGAHPDVLCVRWHVYARAGKWLWAFTVAKAISEFLPDKPFGWVHMAFSLHELKRSQEAMDVLLPVVDKFPDDYLMRYNLACYACQTGNLKGAMDWLEKAIDLAGKNDLRKMALEDPDLEPLWANIGEI